MKGGKPFHRTYSNQLGFYSGCGTMNFYYTSTYLQKGAALRWISGGVPQLPQSLLDQVIHQTFSTLNTHIIHVMYWFLLFEPHFSNSHPYLVVRLFGSHGIPSHHWSVTVRLHLNKLDDGTDLVPQKNSLNRPLQYYWTLLFPLQVNHSSSYSIRQSSYTLKKFHNTDLRTAE